MNNASNVNDVREQIRQSMHRMDYHPVGVGGGHTSPSHTVSSGPDHPSSLPPPRDPRHRR